MAETHKLRALGYTAFLTMYIANMHYMDSFASRQKDTKDERLLAFKGLGNRFFTTWTLMLQMFYIVLSLLSDMLNNYKINTNGLLQYLDKFRDFVFPALVWPSTLVVFTIFWTLFNYDRSLIFPEYLDQVLPPISNHVMHTFIVPVVLFEVLLRPRAEPVTHIWNLVIMTVYLAVYMVVLILTYYERGVWLYPIFGQLYGNVSFLLVVAVMYSLFIISYFLQWSVTKMVHGKEKKKTRKPRKRMT